jgi:hypothetical protein
MLPSELTKAEVTITNPPQEALKLTMRLMSQSYGAHAAFLADVEADRHELRLCEGVRLCDFGWHGYCSWFVRGTSP